MTPRRFARAAAVSAAVALLAVAAASVGEPLAFPSPRPLAAAAVLIAAADQESGPVSHLSPPLQPVPALARLADLPAAARQEAARREGAEAGRDPARLDATMDLAPAADLAKPRAALEAADRAPFRPVLAASGAGLMVSHASLEAADPGVPASRSRSVVAGLIRGAWGFDGPVITDDLTMGAAVLVGLCRGVEGALAAGVDLLLVSWDTDRVYPALRCALDAARAGRLERLERVDAGARRAP